jgi:hypothetical protein
MRSHLIPALLAGGVLVLCAASGQAQTYQDYVSGRAYVMTAPAGAAVATVAPGPSYLDYVTGRAYLPQTVPVAPLPPVREPSFREYVSGQAYVLTSPPDGFDVRRDGGLGFAQWAAIPVPYAAYGDRIFTPGWPRPAPSITTTLARSPFQFQPSIGQTLSATPRTWSWTASPYWGPGR